MYHIVIHVESIKGGTQIYSVTEREGATPLEMSIGSDLSVFVTQRLGNVLNELAAGTGCDVTGIVGIDGATIKAQTDYARQHGVPPRKRHGR